MGPLHRRMLSRRSRSQAGAIVLKDGPCGQLIEVRCCRRSLIESQYDVRLVTTPVSSQMRQRTENRIQHKIQFDADILNQKSQHEVAVFLQ